MVGRIHSYQYDPGRYEFTMEWEEPKDARGESVIYFPDVVGLDRGAIHFVPTDETASMEVIEGSRAGFGHIPAGGRQQMRQVSMASQKTELGLGG